MQLQWLDWIVAGVCLLICFAPALFFGRRAGQDTSEFFVSGRAVPWWLGGLSMVADLGFGLPPGTAVRTCLVGAALARHMTLDDDDVRDLLVHNLEAEGYGSPPATTARTPTSSLAPMRSMSSCST